MSLWTKDGRQVSGFPQAPKRQTPPTFGQAQPIQPPPTPYGQPQQQPARPATTPAPRAQDFSVYRPQQAQGNPFAQYNPQQMGNFVQQMSGLPSFQFSATDSFGNTYDNPAALTAQQGAMAQALNAQRGQQIQSGNFGQLNPMAAYQQAQNMVQGGWTNPFAAQPVAPPSQGTPYGMPQSQAGFGSSMLGPPSQGMPYGQPMPFDPALQQNIDYTLGQRQSDGRPTVRSQMLQDLMQNVSPNDPAFRQKAMELNPATDTVRELGGRLGQALQASGAAESASSRAGREFARNEMYADSRARTIAAGRSDSGPPQWEGSRVNGVSSGAYGMGPGGQINFTPAGQAQPIQPPQARPGGPGNPFLGGTYYQPALPGGSMPSFGGGFSMPPQGQGPGSSFYPGGQAQPVQPPSQGTRYGTPPDQRGGPRTHQFIDGDGDGVDDRDQDGPGMPRYGAPPRRGSFERDAVGMPILRAPNDPSNPTRPMPQPWITTNVGGRVISMPPRPATPRRQPFFY